MCIANLTLIYLTTSHLLSSPFFIQASTSNSRLIAFQHSALNHFTSNFYYSSPSLIKNYRGNIFSLMSFSNFLSSPIQLEEFNLENITHTDQKSVTVYSDIFIRYCTFKNCFSTAGSGGGLSVTTAASKLDAESTHIKFQLYSSYFYNCSALSGGGMFVQFNGEINVSYVCFNSCEAKVSNQAGFISYNNVSPSSQNFINYSSIFRCPGSTQSSLSSNRGMKNCFQIKADEILFQINYINSTYNKNNNDRGCILTIAGLQDIHIFYSSIMNNDGSDGFSILHVKSLTLEHCSLINNSFSVAPFNSYGSIAVTQSLYVSLHSIRYINNNVSNVKNVTGSFIICISNYEIEPLESSFGCGDIVITLYPNYNRLNDNNPISSNELNSFPDSCYMVQFVTTSTAKKSSQISLDLIIYCLIGGCCFIIICISAVLVVYCVMKKRKLKKWIEENETSKQNSSLSTSTFVDPLLEQNN